MTHSCPIRGHHHDLIVIKTHVQVGTGATAKTYECPTGLYRWFVLDGKAPSPTFKFTRPHWGWAKT